jgi:hypothetical protein
MIPRIKIRMYVPAALGTVGSDLFENMGPEGLCKKLQNLDPMQLEGGFGGITSLHIIGF